MPPLLALPPPSASSAKVFAERRSLAVRHAGKLAQGLSQLEGGQPARGIANESEYARSDSTAGLAEAVELETRSMAEGKQLIDARLARLGLSSVLMMDDGNCQFRALSHQLFGDQSFHKEVRAEVVAWMKTHAASFAPFVGGRSDFYRYVADMGKNRCWGDELTLRAACDAFRCVLFIVQSTKTNWLLVYEPGRNARRSRAEDRDAHRKTVFLSYIAPCTTTRSCCRPATAGRGARPADARQEEGLTDTCQRRTTGPTTASREPLEKFACTLALAGVPPPRPRRQRPPHRRPRRCTEARAERTTAGAAADGRPGEEG